MAVGVALANGEEHRARVVASNADANVTFNRLLDNRLLPPSFAEAVNRIQYDSRLAQDQRRPVGTARLHRLPGDAAGPQHRGTIHICPDMDYLERAL